MKKALVLATALTLGLGVCALAADMDMTGHAAAQMAGHVDGKALYAAKCASCHGAEGTKSLLSKPVKGLSAEAVTNMMLGYKAKTYGGSKKATMENLASALSAEEIKAVAAFVSTL
jgi:cytochrome c553